MSELSVNLKAARQARGLSVLDLAKCSGLSRGYLYLLENGECSPTYDKLLKLSQVLKTPLIQLIGETERIIPTPAEVELIYKLRLGDIGGALRVLAEIVEPPAADNGAAGDV